MATRAGYFNSMPPKPRFPPLTSDQLRAIYEANPSTAVRRLLWEIHRLRVVAIHADDFVRMAVYHKSDTRLDPHSLAMFKNLQRLVGAEPLVKEREAGLGGVGRSDSVY
jgi:hypothetical protein